MHAVGRRTARAGLGVALVLALASCAAQPSSALHQSAVTPAAPTEVPARSGRCSRKKLVANLVNVVQRLGFAGLELDWEPIADADEQPLAALVTDLRRAVPNIVLTMSVGWVSTTFPTVSPFYKRVAPQLDQLGVGFYGQCWAGGVNGPRQAIRSSKIVAEDNDMSYANIMSSYFQQSAFAYDRDAEAPYLGFSAPRGPKGCTYVSYENARSIAAKGAYARVHGLGGAIVWTINQGHVRNAPAGQRDALLQETRAAFGA